MPPPKRPHAHATDRTWEQIERLGLGLMSVAKLQVSLVRLVRLMVLESLPLDAYLWIYESESERSRSQIPARRVRSGPPLRIRLNTLTYT